MSLNPTDSGTVDSGVKDPGSTPIWSSPGEGGSGGNPFDDFQPSLGGVTEIRVWADKYIDAIQVAYVDTVTPKHGGGGGHAYTFFFGHRRENCEDQWSRFKVYRSTAILY